MKTIEQLEREANEAHALCERWRWVLWAPLHCQDRERLQAAYVRMAERSGRRAYAWLHAKHPIGGTA